MQLLDLLRLASVGQSMELLAAIRQQHQLQLQLQLQMQLHQDSNQQQETRSSGRRSVREANELGQAQATNRSATNSNSLDCAPLDLTTRSEPQSGRKQTNLRKYRPAPLKLPHSRSTSNDNDLARQTNHNKIGSKTSESGERSKAKVQNGAKLITSSTSPSSVASTSSLNSSLSSASPSEKTNNHNKIGKTRRTNNSSELISSTNGANLNATSESISTSNKPNRKQKGLKSHLCHQCGRSFSRSDMLTRHSRLHSGLKPYQCGKCLQVFSRSDHLSTHERTHTGEKPYQCEFCSYSACRRDMITRHMRTHSTNGDKTTRANKLLGSKHTRGSHLKEESNSRNVQSDQIVMVCEDKDEDDDSDEISTSFQDNTKQTTPKTELERSLCDQDDTNTMPIDV